MEQPGGPDNARGGPTWNDFKDLLAEMTTLCGALAGLFAIAPALGNFQITQQWFTPYPASYANWATVSCVVWVLMLVFLLWRCPADRFDRWIRGHLISAIAFFVLYVGFRIALIGVADGHIYLRGFAQADDAAQAIAAGYVQPDTGSLLDYYGTSDLQQDRVWRFRTASKILLTLLFSFAFAATCGYFALFMLKQHLHPR